MITIGILSSSIFDGQELEILTASYSWNPNGQQGRISGRGYTEKVSTGTGREGKLQGRVLSFSTEIRLVETSIFFVVTHGSQIWTVKRNDGNAMDAFEFKC